MRKLNVKLKTTVCLLLAAVLLCGMLGCSGADVGTTENGNGGASGKTRIAALKGPTGVGMAKLTADDDAGAEKQYEVTFSSSPEDVKAGILNGSYDIAAIPTNLAATLYNKAKAEIAVLAVNTYGVLYVLEDGDTVHSVADLRGKTLYATGQASTPEYILDYVLKQNGMTPGEDVEIRFVAEHAELAAQLSVKNVSLGMLPEPNVTSAILQSGGTLRIALDLTKEWKKINKDTEIMQGCIVVSKAFLAQHPEKVDRFMTDCEASVTYVREHPEEAAGYCETYGIIPKAALAQKAIPNCSLTFVTGAELKTKLNAFLAILFEADPSSVGGMLPDDGFYAER